MMNLRTTIPSALAVVLLSSFAAHAQLSVSSDFMFGLPPAQIDNYVDQLVNATHGTTTITQSQMVVPDTFPATLSNITALVSYNLETPVTIQSGQQWNIGTSQLSATIQIASFSASQVIVQNIGGIIVNTTLVAECSNLQISLAPGAGSVSAVVSANLANQNLAMSVSQVKWNWQASDWTVQIGSCQGVSGLATYLTQQIQTMLTTNSVIANLLTTQLQAALAPVNQTGSTLMTDRTLPTSVKGLTITMHPTSLNASSTGLMQMNGSLNFAFTTPNDSGNLSYTLDPSTTLSTTQTSLVVPLALTQGLLRGYYSSSNLVYTFSMNSISAFQSFLANWFEEIFVWPDLLNFSSKQQFVMQAWPAQMPTLTWSTQGLNAVMSGQINGQMSLLRSNAYEKYQLWNLNTQLATAFAVQNGELSVQTSQPQKFKLSVTWDPAYLSSQSPDTYVDTSTIGSAVKSSLNGFNYTMKLPTLPLTDSFVLEAASATRQGANLQINLAGSPAASQ